MVVLLVVLSAVAFAKNWKRSVTQCEICGRYIYEYVEDKGFEHSRYYDNMGVTYWPPEPMPPSVPDSQQICRLNYDRDIVLCPKCKEQYWYDLVDEADSAWTKKLRVWKNMNKKIVRMHEDQWKHQQEAEIDSQIKDLRRKRDEVRNPPKEEKNFKLFFGHKGWIRCDSVNNILYLKVGGADDSVKGLEIDTIK